MVPSTTTAPKTGTVTRANSITDEDRAAARLQMPRAFAILGLMGPQGPRCPVCGQEKKGKVKLHADGWKCFTDVKHAPRANGSLYCDAIDLLRDAGYSFRDAVNALLDRPVNDVRLAKKVYAAPEQLAGMEPEFSAVIDSEIYEAVMRSAHVSLERAQEFYGTWHIDPHAVREAGARYVLDAHALHEELTKAFGLERLVNAGLVKPKDLDNVREGGYFLVNKDYPLIEPHCSPAGVIVGMQFRASEKTVARMKAYPDKKAAYDAARDAWVAQGKDPKQFSAQPPRYVPKFLSLRGATVDSLVGCGLWRVGRLRHPSQIYVVEGFKDLLAARTMGREAYAIPGVGVMPPERVLAFFAKRGHSLRICLDADSAGRSGTTMLTNLLTEKGIPFDMKQGIPEGMDVTDVLVDRIARQGCTCATCVAWRASEH